MNEKRLDELLKKKSGKTPAFTKTEAGFTADFFSKIEQQEQVEQSRIIRFSWILRVAAVAVILLLAGAVLYLQTGGGQDKFAIPQVYSAAVSPQSGQRQSDSYAVIQNTLAVFGNETAVVYINDELMTGDRERGQAENLVVVNLVAENGKILNLQLACADQDMIRLNSPQITGEIITSRCDSKTLVLDIDLNLNGKRLRLNVPAIRRNGNRYTGDTLT